MRAMRGAFDAVIAPYHDVGMTAIKVASFGGAVNVTLGLPFPRTSPDHGTAWNRGTRNRRSVEHDRIDRPLRADRSPGADRFNEHSYESVKRMRKLLIVALLVGCRGMRTLATTARRQLHPRRRRLRNGQSSCPRTAPSSRA